MAQGKRMAHRPRTRRSSSSVGSSLSKLKHSPGCFGIPAASALDGDVLPPCPDVRSCDIYRCKSQIQPPMHYMSYGEGDYSRTRWAV